MLRFGVVTQVDEPRCRVRVQFTDLDGMLSPWLRVGQRWTVKDKGADLPDVGDQVACMLTQDNDDGIVVDGIYNDRDQPAVASVNKWYRRFGDDTVLEYDREAHRLLADLGATRVVIDRAQVLIECNGKTFRMSGEGFALVGAVNQSGGDMTSGGISAQNHTHGGIQPGSGSTAPPQ